MDFSPLSLLPRELRDIIYEYTFTTPYAVTLQTSKIQHPLTRTCGQLRRESLQLYLSLTRFNAHPDQTPWDCASCEPWQELITWLKALGPESVAAIKSIGVWDLHDLQATIHGSAATARLLKQGPPSGNQHFILDEVERAQYWYIHEIDQALHHMELGIVQFYLVGDSVARRCTSEFAIVGWRGGLSTLRGSPRLEGTAMNR